MKLTKLSLLTLLAAGTVLAHTPTAQAQDKPQRPQRPAAEARGPRGDQLKEMAEKLNLTAEQKTKLQEAMQSQRENRKDLKDATPEERRTAMKEAREKMDAKIKEILTPEQYTKWQELRKEARPGAAPAQKAPAAKK